jgi:hypothetical protein
MNYELRITNDASKIKVRSSSIVNHSRPLRYRTEVMSIGFTDSITSKIKARSSSFIPLRSIQFAFGSGR